MAIKDDLLGVASAETVIGTGVNFKGTLVAEGDIVIDGSLRGDIKTAGNVSVGVNGVVKADIRARNVLIAGHIDGNIHSQGETAITETGKVKGNVTTVSLAVSPGAIFIGSSIMTQAEKELPQAKEAK